MTTITSIVTPTGLTAGTARVRTKDVTTASSAVVKATANGAGKGVTLSVE